MREKFEGVLEVGSTKTHKKESKESKVKKEKWSNQSKGWSFVEGFAQIPQKVSSRGLFWCLPCLNVESWLFMCLFNIKVLPFVCFHWWIHGFLASSLEIS